VKNPNIELYHFERCPYCEKARRAFRFLNLEYESHLVSPSDRSEVIAVSGQSGVPVIVDNDTEVHDSTAIIEYLDEHYVADTRLIPQNRSERGEAYLLNSFAEKVWGPLTYRAMVEVDSDGNPLDEAGKEKLQDLINEQAGILDDFFHQRKFAVNKSTTLADFALSAFPSRIVSHSDFEIYDSFVNFWEWYNRLDSRLKESVITE